MENKYRVDRFSKSQIAFRKPTELKTIIVTPKTTGNTYVKLYDGVSTEHRGFLSIRALANQSAIFTLPDGFILQLGLYIAFDTYTETVTIFTKPV